MTHPFSVYLFLLRQTYLLANLETVETFAINTYDGTLADKGGRINLVDETEYLLRLTLTRQYKQHVDILATVTAMTIHHRTTSVGSGIDGCTELQIFVADDEELFCLDDTAPPEIYTLSHTLSLRAALPIWLCGVWVVWGVGGAGCVGCVWGVGCVGWGVGGGWVG